MVFPFNRLELAIIVHIVCSVKNEKRKGLVVLVEQKHDVI